MSPKVLDEFELWLKAGFCVHFYLTNNNLTKLYFKVLHIVLPAFQ